MTRDDVYYRALQSRDHRFDGKFFVGVKTTGIYCRPVCPAKPKRENVEFFPNHLSAERAGYRPCLRCRPESAPLSPAWIGKTAIVQRAVKMINNQDTIEFDEDRFAALFGVTARHLRRVFVDEIGKTPKQLSFENRLNLARKLITETALPMTEIAFASGFGSIRRFNDAFKERFKKIPTEVRRQKISAKDPLTLSLSYRPPFDFEGLLYFYRTHQVGGLEWFTEGKMHRVVSIRGKTGTVAISNDPDSSQILVEIDFPDSSLIHTIISRVRSLFDIDSDPVIVANSLETDARVKGLLKKHSGVRLPSGWDGFEVAVSTILGQLVSVPQGCSLVGALIELLGEESGLSRDGRAIKLFPSPQAIASGNLQSLATTTIRKQTLKDFAGAVAEEKLSLEPTQDVSEFIEAVSAIRGIGPWTANYMAMKVLRHTDAFPETDLILARALELHPKDIVDRMSPWRAYAAALFWKEYSTTLRKRSKK